ncbi:hypothetical protein [Micromonospora sp. WMMC273]|uniref:hypothetical protein n=1 Tax=Micromonospora sp. WMMC273 TaxID=3015157 RepID=UPI0022B63E6C|nr:hypothetical protein [Micromonospora sp. WMMC273]MCZ7478839.1 hypothetical protein [Micromonospora sp. WMMC273]MCZ7478967.1 hypothetical protein [Micromonospora sp. WMMC273]
MMATASDKESKPLTGRALERKRQQLINDETLVDMPGIAKMLGVEYQTVKSWRKDYRNNIATANEETPHPKLLPKEDGPDIPGKPTWKAGTIRRWAMQTGRMTPDGQAVKMKPPGRPRKTG